MGAGLLQQGRCWLRRPGCQGCAGSTRVPRFVHEADLRDRLQGSLHQQHRPPSAAKTPGRKMIARPEAKASILGAFRQIWLSDFEFVALPGERPEPVCLVARELRTNQELRIFRDELFGIHAPVYPLGPDVLHVHYYSSAEMGCHLALGWPPPARILDLHAEFRNRTAGLTTPHGRGLLGALQWYGLDAMAVVEKEAMRTLIQRGGPWSASEREAILNYCAADVDALARLLPAMLVDIDLPRALL